MSKETVNKILNKEKDFHDKLDKANESAAAIIKNADAEAKEIIDSKIKNALKNAELRINIAKQTAKKNKETALKECQLKIDEQKKNAEKKKKEAIEMIVDMITSK